MEDFYQDPQNPQGQQWLRNRNKKVLLSTFLKIYQDPENMELEEIKILSSPLSKIVSKCYFIARNHHTTEQKDLAVNVSENLPRSRKHEGARRKCM